MKGVGRATATWALAAILAGVATSLGGCSSAPAVRGEPLAVRGRAEVARLGDNQFRVECRGFERVEASQQDPAWCWAASVEMVRRFNGERVSQEEIATQIHGADNRRGAGMNEIMVALNPDLELRLDRVLADGKVEIDWENLIASEADRLTINADDMIAELSGGYPVVIGLSNPDNPSVGHACVVHAVTYRRRELTYAEMAASSVEKTTDTERLLGRAVSLFLVDRVEYFDPWPGEGERALEGSQPLANVDFMIGKAGARRILERRLRTLR